MASTDSQTTLLKGIGSARLLPTVGTHERPLSESQLHQRFASPEDAALFLLLTSWEDALFGAVSGGRLCAVGEDELARRHYRTVWQAATEAEGFTDSVVALLLQCVDGAPSSDAGRQLAACVTLIAPRAHCALSLIEGQPQGDHNRVPALSPQTKAWMEQVSDRILGPNSTCILRPQLVATDPNATSGVVQALVAYTVLLLTEYRSCKQAAARKWVAFARQCCQQSTTNTPLSAHDVCGVALCASLALCIPCQSDAQVRPLLPLLSPSFVALFWTFVVEHLTATGSGSGDGGSAQLLAAIPVQLLVDAFGCVMQLHLGRVDGSAKAKTGGVLVGWWGAGASGGSSSSSDDSNNQNGLSPAAYDAFFAVFVPTLLQQFGFEFPWSSFVRLGRAIVNEGKSRAGTGSAAAIALSARCDRCWQDVVECLALRSYRERLEQVLPPSLGGYLDDVYYLSGANMRGASMNASDATKVQALNDLGNDVSQKLAAAVDQDSAKAVIDVAMHAIDALPFVVQLRSKQSASLTATPSSAAAFAVHNERLVCLLWLFLCASNRLTVRGHYQDVFQSLFASRVEAMRNGVDSATEFGERRRSSPFADVATLWLKSLSPAQPNDDRAETVAALLRHSIGVRMLRFMLTCYLPVHQSATQTSLGLAIAVRDLIPVVRFALGAPADSDHEEVDCSKPAVEDHGTSLWASAPSEVRMLVRGITARLIDVQRRTAVSSSSSGASLNDVDAHLLGLEWEQWVQFLHSTTHHRTGNGNLRWVSPVWVAPTAVTQASLQSQ